MKKEQMNVALDPALKAKVRGMYKSDNCSTMTEFVQKAVEFYIGSVSYTHLTLPTIVLV